MMKEWKMKKLKINSISSQIRKEGKPVLPTKRQEHDPTKQGATRKKAVVDINKRYSLAKNEIVKATQEFIAGTPREIISNNVSYANNRLYNYEVDYSRLSSFTDLIQRILFGFLDLVSAISPTTYFLSNYVKRAYYSGTSDTIQSAGNVASPTVISPTAIATLRSMSLDEMINDPQYQRRVGLVAGRSFEAMKGLTEQTRSDLSDTLARGMALGQSTSQITNSIVERLDVSRSRAERIARTEINNAYRTATRQETEAVNQRLFQDEEYEMRLLWYSALSPTTRPTHARRHGRTYTQAEVADFYSKDGNAINCLCSQVAVLVNKKTGEPYQQALVKEMRQDKRHWQEKELAA